MLECCSQTFARLEAVAFLNSPSPVHVKEQMPFKKHHDIIPRVELLHLMELHTESHRNF